MHDPGLFKESRGEHLNEEQGSTAERQCLLWLKGTKDHAVIGMDTEGVVTWWAGAAEDVFGFSAAEAIGKPLSIIFTLEDQLKGLDRYERELAGAHSNSQDDRWHVRRDGSRVWVTGTVTALRDPDDRLLGFVKVARDRTDLRTQIELVESEAAALRASRQRTHTFLKTLGHELRNPLAPLSSAVHIIRRLEGGPKIDEALLIISRQITAITRLADDLMDISRLESGKVTLNPAPVDLRKFLAAAVDGVVELAAGRGVTVTALLPDGALEVDLDEARFQQVVLNLLGNAIKYTPSGGSIWVKATQEGDEVLFRVEDTGIGIAPDVLPRIFDLFTRDHAAMELAPAGLGVGLAMVREITELHGGSVQARSAGTGKGSEFTVRLPARPAAPAATPASATPL